MIERHPPSATGDRTVGPMASGGQTFSEWLRLQLKARKMTQRQLAQKSGVDHSTVSRLLRGDRIPSLRTANPLAHSLGMPDGPDGIHRQGSWSSESPAARVERALRLDDLLDESQVRDVMNVYLASRRRRLHLVAAAGGETTGSMSPLDRARVSREAPRSTAVEGLAAAARGRSG
jgi:transcriptional regulator with XRE-family HTH domain